MTKDGFDFRDLVIISAALIHSRETLPENMRAENRKAAENNFRRVQEKVEALMEDE